MYTFPRADPGTCFEFAGPRKRRQSEPFTLLRLALVRTAAPASAGPGVSMVGIPSHSTATPSATGATAATNALANDSPAFVASFNRWRLAITSLVSSDAATAARSPVLRCESEQQWEDGKVMQTPERDLTDSEKRQQAKECKRCEQWRDEVIRESEPSHPSLLVHAHWWRGPE